MPQPKSRSPRKRPRKAPARREEENVTRGAAALRELLNRALIVPTERVREALDDAVRRGRMTRSDAEDLAAALIAIGRRQTEEALADLDQLLGPAAVRREVDRARRAVGLGSGGFPIANYDELAAAQIIDRLDDLQPAELRKVRDYERRHGNRKTVLSAIERKLG